MTRALAAFVYPALSLVIAADAARAATLRVGPGLAFARPSEAAAVARDGDVVEIQAGVYKNDVAVWRASNLTLRGVGGRARLWAGPRVAEGKAIWVLKGRNTTVEHVEFAYARAPDRNGAGIRLEGPGLSVRHCLFRENENGILTGGGKDSEVLIEYSEFDHNGHGDGYSHNLYIGAVAKLTLRYSLSRNARIGHHVKSRATRSLIVNNRIEDGPDGRSSYLIDLPAGGEAEIVGNHLVQGPHAENSTMISYGAEKRLHARNQLVVRGNAFINQRPGDCILINILKPADAPAEVSGNTFKGCWRFKGLVNLTRNTLQDAGAGADGDAGGGAR